MFADLFGSYSIPTTVAGIPSFFLLKSTILYFFLSTAAAMSYSNLTLCVTTCFLFLESRSDFSGVVFVISEKSDPVICLLEGVYGLYVLIPITFSPFISSNYLFLRICTVYSFLYLTVLLKISYFFTVFCKLYDRFLCS